MRRRNSLLLGCLLAAIGAAAQNNWELQQDQSGIRIYTRSTDSSRYDEIKVETNLRGKLSSLASLLLDIGNYPNWSFNSEKAYVLKWIGPAELYYYSLIRSPWPASNRDLALHLRIYQDSDTRILHVEADESANYVPENKGIVRVPRSTERWTVTPMPGGNMSVIYDLRLDPGASVPAWLINKFSTRGPLETFTNLRKQLLLPKYRDALLPFIRN